MDQVEELHEFPVIIEETNEIITLFLNETDKERAMQGKIYNMYYYDFINV